MARSSPQPGESGTAGFLLSLRVGRASRRQGDRIGVLAILCVGPRRHPSMRDPAGLDPEYGRQRVASGRDTSGGLGIPEIEHFVCTIDPCGDRQGVAFERGFVQPYAQVRQDLHSITSKAIP